MCETPEVEQDHEARLREQGSAAALQADAYAEKAGPDTEEVAATWDPEIDPALEPQPGPVGAEVITKVYLVGRKTPVLIEGAFEDVVDAFDVAASRSGGAKPFQIVTRDGMLTGDRVVFNIDHVVSIASDNRGE